MHRTKVSRKGELFNERIRAGAQIILRWHTQLGHVVIPGSRNPEHIRANIDLFDFELTQDDMNDIATVDREKRYYTATKEALEGYLSFAPDFDAQE